MVKFSTSVIYILFDCGYTIIIMSLEVRFKLTGFTLFIFFCAFFFLGFRIAYASTDISEDISVDTTWAISGSPYLVQNTIAVLPNTTLAIEPGVVVKFNPDTSPSVIVLGKVLADGTESQKIYFTSNYDDEFHSDTDDEEFCYDELDAEDNPTGVEICESFDLGEPLPGDWNGFYFNHSSSSILQNVVIKYADDALILDNSSANLKNVNTENSYTGLTAFNHSAVEFTGGNLTNLDKDAIVLFNNSSINIKDLTISNIADDPISVFNTSTLSALNLTIKDLPSFDFPFTDVLALFNSSTLSIKNSNFEYCPGEACITFFNGNDYLANPVNLMIENTKFSGGTGSALLTFGAGESITNIKNSSIKNFINYGVENYSNITVNAENNDWGDKTGPYHITLNPDGLGQMIYGNIDFEPWVGQEGPIPDTFYANIKNAPSGVAQMYMNANTSELVKTFPNDWILKVFSKTLTTDGWIKVQDMTDGSAGWMNTIFEYEESKQGEFEEDSSVQVATKKKRAEEILKTISHYYDIENQNSGKSLYNSDDNFFISKLTKVFPKDLVMAIASQEIGDFDFDNERVSIDYGHGIMQITFAKYKDKKGAIHYYDNRGIVSDLKLNQCQYVEKKKDTSGLNDYLKCYKPVLNSKGNAFKQVYDNYEHRIESIIFKQYTNTKQSIYANIKDGLGILYQKNQLARNTSCKKGNYTVNSLVFNCEDLVKVKTVWFYNGKSFRVDQPYMSEVSKKLKNLSSYFEGYSYSNDDKLIEKLKTANDNRKEINLHSPVRLRIKDSSGSVTGITNGETVNEIDNSVYDADNERAVIFFPDDTYTYEVVGDSEGGTYGLDIDDYDDSEIPLPFNAIGIPISHEEIHTYKVDKNKLAENAFDAVTITIDKNGDGVPERTIHSGNTLTSLDQVETPVVQKVVDLPGAVLLSSVTRNSTPSMPQVLGAESSVVNGKEKEKLIYNIKPKTFAKNTSLNIKTKKPKTKQSAQVISANSQSEEKTSILLPVQVKKFHWWQRIWRLLVNL